MTNHENKIKAFCPARVFYINIFDCCKYALR